MTNGDHIGPAGTGASGRGARVISGDDPWMDAVRSAGKAMGSVRRIIEQGAHTGGFSGSVPPPPGRRAAAATSTPPAPRRRLAPPPPTSDPVQSELSAQPEISAEPEIDDGLFGAEPHPVEPDVASTQPPQPEPAAGDATDVPFDYQSLHADSSDDEAAVESQPRPHVSLSSVASSTAFGDVVDDVADELAGTDEAPPAPEVPQAEVAKPRPADDEADGWRDRMVTTAAGFRLPPPPAPITLPPPVERIDYQVVASRTDDIAASSQADTSA